MIYSWLAAAAIAAATALAPARAAPACSIRAGSSGDGNRDNPASSSRSPHLSRRTEPISLPLVVHSERATHPDPRIQLEFAQDEAVLHRLKYARALDDEGRALLRRDLARIARRDEGVDESIRLTNYLWDMGYAVPVAVGTPPQEFLAVADTGSHGFVLFDSHCDDCAGHPTFDYSLSDSFIDFELPIYQQYGMGNATGTWIGEEVTMGGHTISNQSIILVNSGSVSKFMGKTVSGIMGLAWRSGYLDAPDGDAHQAPVPFWETLAQEEWKDRQFGFYLNRTMTDPSDFQSKDYNGSIPQGGILTLGGVDSSLFEGEIRYMDSNTTYWWQLELDAFSVDDETVYTGSVWTIIDTGSTGTNMPAKYTAAMHDMIPGAFPLYDSEGNATGQFAVPCNTSVVVSYRLGGYDYQIGSADLLRTQISGSKDMCLSSVSTGHWLLGASFLKNVYTAFRYDPPSIGFAPLHPSLNMRPNGNWGSDSHPSIIAYTSSATPRAPQAFSSAVLFTAGLVAGLAI